MSDEIGVGNVNIYADYEARLMAPGEAVPRHMGRVTDKVRDLAVRYAPKRTGRLAESAEDRREGDEWIVRFGAGYSAAVELGHRVVRRGRTVGYVGPQPYLRPALDQVMAESNG